MKNIACSQELFYRRYWLAIIALLIVPISGLSIDIYVPSLPAISHYFTIDKTFSQLTITVYMIGFGMAQLFSGAVSDSLGRKKPCIIAMVIYITDVVLITFTHNIDNFLLLRFIQGLAVAFFNVPMRAVIADLFENEDFYKMMNYMTIIWALGPLVAPFIGGYLQNYYGWHAPFYFLGIYSFIMFLINILFMPETIRYKNSYDLKKFIKISYEMITNLNFIVALICASFMYSLIIIFAIIGPFLIQEILHYSAIDYGRIALIIGFAWFMGNMTNRLTSNVKLVTKVKICFWIMLIIDLVALLTAIILPISIYEIIISVSMIVYFGGIVLPNYYAMGIALFPKTTAIANSFVSAFMFLLAGLISVMGTMLKSNTHIPLLIAYFFIILICLISQYSTN